nr:hypothetical protein [Tanacetum cinerariifolium]
NIQLVVVVVEKNKHKSVKRLFDVLSTLTNVVCGPDKRKEILQESHKEILVKEIEKGENETTIEKNQEDTFARFRDTRWSSQHRTMISLIKKFSEAFKALHYVEEEGDTISNRETTTDMKIKKFGDRFSEGSTDLLDCMVALSPRDSFLESNVSDIAKLAKKMVDKKRYTSHPLIYQLLKLLGIRVGCGDNPGYLTRIVLSSLLV